MENLLGVIFEWQNIIIRCLGIKREQEDEILASIGSKPIKIITGFRRSGKSFIVQRIVKQLINNNKYNIDNVLYLNFEDFRLSEINSAKKLYEVYELFISKVSTKGKKLLVFDEIQNVKDWDKFIRTIYEKEINIEIILTGSNSQMLSSELGSNLAGRFLEYFILPFSFKEYLTYKNIAIDTENDFLRNRIEIKREFNEFVSYGGFPEIFDIQNIEAKKSYINGIVAKVILDDIVKRFSVDNVDVLEKLLGYIMFNIGQQISYTKLQNIIKNYGINIKSETITNYVRYFKQSFSIFEINKFDWKQGRIFPTKRKYFTVDQSILNLYRPEKENYSLRIENIVYLQFKRENRHIDFGMDSANKEIDFITKDKAGLIEKIQVCTSLTDKNYNREIGNLISSDTYFKNSKSILFTLDDDNTIEIKEKSIERKNIIKWLLGF